MLEAILNTLLMNDKSKDIAKARQDLKRLGIRNWLVAWHTKNGKCQKPQLRNSFKPENKKVLSDSSRGVNYQIVPEIDTYQSQFKRQKEELPNCLVLESVKRHVDNEPRFSAIGESFAFGLWTTPTPIASSRA
ncbi:hypothetical protein Tco_0604458 [Tanacetum coccineum]